MIKLAECQFNLPTDYKDVNRQTDNIHSAIILLQ